MRIRVGMLLLSMSLLGGVGPAGAQPESAQGEATEEAARFDVWEYRVVGNSVLAARDIETIVYPHLGPQKSLAEVENVRAALELLYRDRGYGAVFVDIPEQDVVNGLVRLRVTEGRLEQVRVKEPRYFSAGRIRSSLPSLESGEVVNVEALQGELAALNRQSADRQVTPVLKPGSAPGTIDVDLNVKDALPFHGSIDVNDRYTADTSRTRVGINLSYDNLFQKFHRLSLQYQTAPEEPDESRVIAATYVAPVATDDLIAAYVVDTSSDFSTVSGLGGLGILGTGRIYGVRYINVLPGTERGSASLTFGADHKDFEDRIDQSDGLSDVTPIEYVNWSVVYAAGQRGEQTQSSQTLGVNFGIRGLGNSTEEFAFKRYKAKPNYFYLRGEAIHDLPFYASSRLFLRLAGQLTLEPLISNEQFSIGGADSVRGYLEAEQLGDNGAFANVELRAPPWAGPWLGQGGQAYLFGFVDAGVVGILEALPVDGEKTSRYNLASAGVGARVTALRGLQAEFEWAYPFEETENVDRGESRLHFQLLYGF